MQRPARAAPHNGHPRRNLSQFVGADAVAIPTVKGPPTMMPDLTALALLTTAGTAVLAAVYLWSADPGRRRRAWQLLKLFLSR